MDEERLVATAAAALERQRIESLPFEERQQALQAARTREDTARNERQRKWDAKKAAAKEETEEKRGTRPVETTSRLGPVALRSIAMPADVPPPWCAAIPGADPPPPMEIQVADPDDLDWQAANRELAVRREATGTTGGEDKGGHGAQREAAEMGRQEGSSEGGDGGEEGHSTGGDDKPPGPGRTPQHRHARGRATALVRGDPRR